MAENDWDGFRAHTAALGDKIQIVGDDLYATNTRFIARGIQEKSTNAVLIKLNQIGLVTETIESIQRCQKAGWGYVVSHRSGETEDAFLADFAVAMGGGQQVDKDQEEEALKLARYDFLAIPVVDEQQRLVGIITHDDVLDVIVEEATEDALHMAGHRNPKRQRGNADLPR